MSRSLKNGMIVAGVLALFVALASCTTSNLGESVVADKVPAPSAAKSEPDVAPINETDTVTALLQPSATLKPDTVEAALHDVRTSKIQYVGAWAADEAGCGKIDQGAYDSFAVITPTSFRNAAEVCTIKAAPPEDNPATISATCGSSAIEITLLVTAIGGLQIVTSNGAAPVEYLRCQLLK